MRNHRQTSPVLTHILIFLLSFSTIAQIPYIGGHCTPPEGKTLLIIGQDLSSIDKYIKSGHFPTPGGTTTYVGGYDNAALNNDREWGAGPLNASKNLDRYKQSILSIGLSLVEKYFPDGLNKIVEGKYDGSFKDLGEFCKNANRPVFVRIGYEFDGNWNKYPPEKYIKAYQHVVKIARPIGGKNFVSVWQACASPIDDAIEGRHEDITDWYPGSEYVDWFGLSWFITHKEQDSLANEVIEFARKEKKPVLIAESTPQGYDFSDLTKKKISPVWDGTPATGTKSKTPDEIWDEWFKPFFKYTEDNKDVIRAVAYINCNWDAQRNWGPPYRSGYWGDTRFEANEGMRNKWLAEITKPKWMHGSDSLFAILFRSATPIEKSRFAVKSAQRRFFFESGVNRIHFNLPKAQPVAITIRSCTGEKIFTQSYSGVAGQNCVKPEIGNSLAQGLYLLEVNVEGVQLGVASMINVK